MALAANKTPETIFRPVMEGDYKMKRTRFNDALKALKFLSPRNPQPMNTQTGGRIFGTYIEPQDYELEAYKSTTYAVEKIPGTTCCPSITHHFNQTVPK